MSLAFRILRVVVIALLIAVVGFIAVIGPWPVYRKSGYAQAGYFTQALAAITAHGKGQVAEPAADALKAGWHVVDMTPPVGTPMGGYAARAGEKRSTGVRDPLFVKAIAFSDGKETVVVIGADMLMVPPNIAEAVRAAVTKKTGLPQDSIIFNTTHTHCGPGGLAPGAAMDYSAGPYDPAIPAFISEKMTAAAVGAVESLGAVETAANKSTQSASSALRILTGPVAIEIERLEELLSTLGIPAAKRSPFLVTRSLLDSEGSVETLLTNDAGPQYRSALQESRRVLAATGEEITGIEATQRYRFIKQLLSRVQSRSVTPSITLTDRIDSILTHRVCGFLICLAVLMFVK